MPLRETIEGEGGLSASRVFGSGPGFSIAELRELLSRPRKPLGSVTHRGGPCLFLRIGDQQLAIEESLVRLIMTDTEGKPACWWTVEILVDSDARCVRRGTQTFEPIDGREVTATMLRRHLALGDAWHEALRMASVGPDDKRFRSALITPVGSTRLSIDGMAEEEAVARWMIQTAREERRVPSREELRRRLSKELRNNEPVPPGTVGQRLFGARKRGLLPPSDNRTRPTVDSLRDFEPTEP